MGGTTRYVGGSRNIVILADSLSAVHTACDTALGMEAETAEDLAVSAKPNMVASFAVVVRAGTTYAVGDVFRALCDGCPSCSCSPLVNGLATGVMSGSCSEESGADRSVGRR